CQPHDSGLALFQGTRMFGERVRVRQQLTAALYEQLSFGSQTQSPSDVLEQRHPKLRLQRIDLTRSCGLTEMQARAGLAETAVFACRNEGPQILEVQARLQTCQLCIDYASKIAIDTIVAGASYCGTRFLREQRTGQ